MKLVMYSAMCLLIVLSQGCNTIADARTAKGKGQSRVYDASFDTVWKTVPKAVNTLGLSIAGENVEEGCILAVKGMTAFSYGENVAVFVEKAGEGQTRVEVVSKKTMSTNIFAYNWEKPILDKLSEMLSASKG